MKPAEFREVSGFMLFQRLLSRHRGESGQTLLEEMQADLADVSDVVHGENDSNGKEGSSVRAGQYSRYVVQQANQSSQCRVCFAPALTCQHPEVILLRI